MNLTTKKYLKIKEDILDFHLNNDDPNINLEVILTNFSLWVQFIESPQVVKYRLQDLFSQEIGSKEKYNILKNLDSVSSLVRDNPNIIFEPPLKKLILENYQKYFFGTKKDRAIAKDWLLTSLIPEKRSNNQNNESRKDRKYPREYIAELCWHLWGYFKKINMKINNIKTYTKSENAILDNLYNLNPRGIPYSKKWERNFKKLINKKTTPQQLAIEETAEYIGISEYSVKEAIHPRKQI